MKQKLWLIGEDDSWPIQLRYSWQNSRLNCRCLAVNRGFLIARLPFSPAAFNCPFTVVRNAFTPLSCHIWRSWLEVACWSFCEDLISMRSWRVLESWLRPGLGQSARLPVSLCHLRAPWTALSDHWRCLDMHLWLHPCWSRTTQVIHSSAVSLLAIWVFLYFKLIQTVSTWYLKNVSLICYPVCVSVM